MIHVLEFLFPSLYTAGSKAVNLALFLLIIHNPMTFNDTAIKCVCVCVCACVRACVRVQVQASEWCFGFVINGVSYISGPFSDPMLTPCFLTLCWPRMFSDPLLTLYVSDPLLTLCVPAARQFRQRVSAAECGCSGSGRIPCLAGTAWDTGTPGAIPGQGHPQCEGHTTIGRQRVGSRIARQNAHVCRAC